MFTFAEFRRTGLMLAFFILIGGANLYPCTCPSRGNACPSLPTTEDQAIFVGTVTKTAGRSTESLLGEWGWLEPGLRISKADWAAMMNEYKDSILNTWGDYLSDAQIKAIKAHVANDMSLPIPEWYRSRRVWVQVTQQFGGRIGESIELVTGFGGGDCGVSFETGKTFLIFARGTSGSKLWTTSICDGTREIASADDQDVRTLRDLQSGTFAPRIYGDIWKLGGDALVERRVILLRDGKLFRQLQTAQDGTFAFTGLQPGNYSVEVPGFSAEDMRRTYNTGQRLTLTKGGCARLMILVTPDQDKKQSHE